MEVDIVNFYELTLNFGDPKNDDVYEEWKMIQHHSRRSVLTSNREVFGV